MKQYVIIQDFDKNEFNSYEKIFGYLFIDKQPSIFGNLEAVTEVRDQAYKNGKILELTELKIID